MHACQTLFSIKIDFFMTTQLIWHDKPCKSTTHVNTQELMNVDLLECMCGNIQS